MTTLASFGIGLVLSLGLCFLLHKHEGRRMWREHLRNVNARLEAQTREIEARREAAGWKRDERGRLRPRHRVWHGGGQ